jgi:hypothetical protein
LAKNCHGWCHASDLLRRLFEMTVARCMAEGLVGGKGAATGASPIRADGNRQRAVDRREQLPADASGRALRAYFAVRHEAAFGGATPVEPRPLAEADRATFVAQARAGADLTQSGSGAVG